MKLEPCLPEAVTGLLERSDYWRRAQRATAIPDNIKSVRKSKEVYDTLSSEEDLSLKKP